MPGQVHSLGEILTGELAGFGIVGGGWVCRVQTRRKAGCVKSNQAGSVIGIALVVLAGGMLVIFVILPLALHIYTNIVKLKPPEPPPPKPEYTNNLPPDVVLMTPSQFSNVVVAARVTRIQTWTVSSSASLEGPRESCFGVAGDDPRPFLHAIIRNMAGTNDTYFLFWR